VTNTDTPCCSICGIEIFTGLMAAFCSRERCEFRPDNKTGDAFIESFRHDFKIVPEPLGEEWPGNLSEAEKAAQGRLL